MSDITQSDKELMYILYYQENLTFKEIAGKFECSTSLASRYVKQIKAQKRAIRDRQKEARFIASINDIFKQFEAIKKQHRLTSSEMYKLISEVNYDTYATRKTKGAGSNTRS